MKLRTIRKLVRNNRNDYDNHHCIKDLINRIEVILLGECDSLQDEMFDELQIAVPLQEVAIDEDKAVSGNFERFSNIHGTVHDKKSFFCVKKY